MLRNRFAARAMLEGFGSVEQDAFEVSVSLMTASVADNADAKMSTAAKSLVYKHVRPTFLKQFTVAA